MPKKWPMLLTEVVERVSSSSTQSCDPDRCTRSAKVPKLAHAPHDLSLERVIKEDMPFCIQHFLGKKFICIHRLINRSIQAEVCVHRL